VIELLLEAERALSFGLVDRAEALYRQVAAADPKNSIAIVGLARVALERADDAGALTFARQALEIDPENDAARRLTERMEEVLTTRGEALPARVIASPTSPAPNAPPPAEPEPPKPEPPPPAAAATPTAKRTNRRKRTWLDRLRGR
jgi:tetratricopeptide (TPR) repeat protein